MVGKNVRKNTKLKQLQIATSKDMNYRLMRPLTSRFKTDTVYNFPAPNGYVELKAENPLNTPLLSFSEIAIQFEYAAVMPAVKFLAENKNAYSVSLPVQMRYELDGESISNNEINVVNGTLDIFIIETIHNDIESGKEIHQDEYWNEFHFHLLHTTTSLMLRISNQRFNCSSHGCKIFKRVSGIIYEKTKLRTSK